MANENDYSGYRAWKQWNVLFRPEPNEVVLFDREFAGQTLEERKLLDIGFGNGSLLAWARSKGALVEGVEAQAELRLAAQGAGIRAWRTLDEIADQQFDLVTLFDVLEHVPRSDVLAFLSSVVRVAKSGASILVRVPNCQSPAGLINQFGDPTHLSMLSVPIVSRLLEEAGLRVDTGREAVELDIAEGHTLKRFLKPAIRLIARLLRLVYRVTFSTGSTPLSANVLVIAHKP